MQHGVLEAFDDGLLAKRCKELFEEDFDEDTRAGGCVFFVELDDRENVPIDRIGSEEMGEELGDDAEAVGFEAVDCLVVGGKSLFKEVGPHAVQLAETLANHAVELLVRALLARAFHDHGCEFVFQAVW